MTKIIVFGALHSFVVKGQTMLDIHTCCACVIYNSNLEIKIVGIMFDTHLNIVTIL